MLKDNELTRFFLTRRYTPSDVLQASVSLRSQIQSQGIMVHPIPKRNPRYTFDEAALEELLRSPEDTFYHQPRVTHDVDCVASVLQLRRGRSHDWWDDAVAVFATTTGLVVFNVNRWYEQSGQGGVSLIIHVHQLTSIAWLKDPTSSPQLKLHELVALCSVALRPSPQVWESAKAHLRRLEQEGKVDSDEVVSVLASNLTDQWLADAAFDGDPDTTTIEQVIERVRAQYRRDADKRIAEAQEVTTNETERRRKAELAASALIRKLSRAFGWVCYVFLSVMIVVGVFGIPRALFTSPAVSVVSYVLATLVSVFAVLGTLWGTTVREVRGRIETWVEDHLRNWADDQTNTEG